MELNLLPNNDRFHQYCRCLRNDTKEREEEINNCNHLFLKLRKKEYCGGYHSSECYDIPSVLECVHCGLTNKFEPLEDLDIQIEMAKGIYNPEEHKYTKETIMFHKLYKDAYGKRFDESKFNLISEEALNTDQARLLYKLAKLLNPNGNRKELFNIMNELNETEIDLERIKLDKVEDCEDLLIRYKERKLVNSKRLIYSEPKSIWDWPL